MGRFSSIFPAFVPWPSLTPSQATPHPHRLLVGEPGSPGREKLHARVTQAQLQAQTLQRRGVGPSTLASSKKRAAEDYAPLSQGQEAHWEVRAGQDQDQAL